MSQNKLKLNDESMDVASDFCFEYVSGPEKGATFELLEDQISIGRSEDSDLVVNSESVSRKHALIKRSSNGSYYIQDYQSKNGIFINGEKVKRGTLQPGDVVQVGDLVMRFHASHLPALSDSGPVDSLMNRMPELGKAKGRGINKRVLIYGAVGLVLVLALTTGDETPTETAKTGSSEASTASSLDKLASNEPELVSSKNSSAVVGLEDPALTRAEKDISGKEWNDGGLIEAEQYFRQGQREYFAKNYGRAVQNFQTSLSFNPRHRLSLNYLQLTIFEAEKQAKEDWFTARKYFDSLQYSRAIYHFEQVIALLLPLPEVRDVADTSKTEVRHEMMKKSKEYIAIGRKKLKAAELFP